MPKLSRSSSTGWTLPSIIYKNIPITTHTSLCLLQKEAKTYIYRLYNNYLKNKNKHNSM